MAVSVDIKPLAELLDGGFSKSGIRKAFSCSMHKRGADVPLCAGSHGLSYADTVAWGDIRS